MSERRVNDSLPALLSDLMARVDTLERGNGVVRSLPAGFPSGAPALHDVVGAAAVTTGPATDRVIWGIGVPVLAASTAITVRVECVGAWTATARFIRWDLTEPAIAAVTHAAVVPWSGTLTVANAGGATGPGWLYLTLTLGAVSARVITTSIV